MGFARSVSAGSSAQASVFSHTIPGRALIPKMPVSQLVFEALGGEVEETDKYRGPFYCQIYP
jgi:hypothetical protein